MPPLLTTPWDPGEQHGIAQRYMQMQQAQEGIAIRQASAFLESRLADQRRAHEFDRTLEYKKSRDAEDRRQWDFDNRPFVMPSTTTPYLPGNPDYAPTGPMTPIPRTSTAPLISVPEQLDQTAGLPGEMAAAATAPAAPEVEEAPPTSSATPSLTIPTQLPATRDAIEGQTELPAKVGAVNPNTTPGADLFDRASGTPTIAPTATPTSRAASIGMELEETGKVLQKLGLPAKAAHDVLRAQAAASFSRKPETPAAANADNSVMANWPTNENGYRFNPQNPAEQYTARLTPKGTTYTQVKRTDPWYGLQPVGEGMYEDKNGQRFYVDSLRDGKPSLKRIEEDQKVSSRATDIQGRVHSYNKFGQEVAVTDENLNFLSSKSKMFVGSDGNVYAVSADGKPQTPIPPGVRLDQGRSEEAKIFRVGSDGKMYGFKRDSSPITPIPEDVRFDRPKDPEQVTKWEVDEKTGDLHGFNYKGEPIAKNEGDFARIASKADDRLKEATMTEGATYETLKPAVHGLWQVYDSMRTQGIDPHATHEELVAQYGDAGAQMSARRGAAQKAVADIKVKGKSIGRDFAEGYVRNYEVRQQRNPQPPNGAPAPAAPSPAPTTPPKMSPQDRQNSIASAKAALQRNPKAATIVRQRLLTGGFTEAELQEAGL